MFATRSRHRVLLPLLVLSAAACTSDPVSASTSGPLDTATLSAVRAALVDEYHASAVYTAIMSRFGTIAPFVNIERAERQHAASLAALLTSRGLTVPDPVPLSEAPAFASVSAACRAAADAEVANITLYDGLLANTVPADVRRVFENNRRASIENHLPAFERCAPATTP